MTLPQRHIALLLDTQALLIPVAGEHGFSQEQRAEFRLVDSHSLIVAMRHDMQQRLQRRAGRFHAAVLEIVQRHAALRLHDGIDAGGEELQALLFRPQHFLGEHRAGRFENAAQEAVHEKRGDAVAQAAGQHRAPVEPKILHAVPEIRFRSRNCGSRSATRMRHQISGTSMLMS